MNDVQSPYAPPSSNLVQNHDPSDFALNSPRSVNTARGFGWISEGFSYFGKAPATWIGMMLVGFIIMMTINFIPFINFVGAFTTYIWIAGMVLGCKALHDGQQLKLGHLFAGFRTRPWALVNLYALYMLIVMGAVVLLIMPLVFMGIIDFNQFGEQGPPPGVVMLFVLAILAVTMPLMMCVWFAPALIVIHNQPVLRSMSLSFQGCLKNIMPFLVYGVLGLVVMLLAAIPVGLGLLVVFPAMMAANFVAYKDIFVHA